MDPGGQAAAALGRHDLEARLHHAGPELIADHGAPETREAGVHARGGHVHRAVELVEAVDVDDQVEPPAQAQVVRQRKQLLRLLVAPVGDGEDVDGPAPVRRELSEQPGQGALGVAECVRGEGAAGDQHVHLVGRRAGSLQGKVAEGAPGVGVAGGVGPGRGLGPDGEAQVRVQVAGALELPAQVQAQVAGRAGLALAQGIEGEGLAEVHPVHAVGDELHDDVDQEQQPGSEEDPFLHG